MANKFLSESGLKTLWNKICSKAREYADNALANATDVTVNKGVIRNGVATTRDMSLQEFLDGTVTENTQYTLEKDDDWEVFEYVGKSKNVDDFATLTLKGSNDTEQPVKFHMCAISGALSDNSIDGDILKDNCISTSKIKDSAVTSDKIKDSAVTSDKIADGAVTESKLASDVKNKLTGKTVEYTTDGKDKEFSVTWDVPFFVYATDDDYSLYFALCITNGENFQITDMSGKYAGSITMSVSSDNLIVRNATNIKIWYLH